jgi:uncharacterized protein YndB with AHSA1/START domain
MPMAPFVSTIEIDRPPAEVFAYVTDPTHFAEWQRDVVRTELDGARRFVTTRRIGRRERTMTQEISTARPPDETTAVADASSAAATASSATGIWAAHGVDGPIRPSATVTVEPLHHGARSRVTFTLDFVGHGIGVVLLPLVRRQARRGAPTSYRNLKERLEHR